MVMNDKDLIEQNSKRDIWQETLDSVRSIKAGKLGHVETVELPPVVEACQRVGFSLLQFAELLGVSACALQDWKQSRCKSSRAAISFIKIAKQRPDVLREVFG